MGADVDADQGVRLVVSDVERDQWVYVPGRTLGPLRMDMSEAEVVTALAAHGFIPERRCSSQEWHLIWFAKDDGRSGRAPVECYFGGDGSLACVFVDGHRGPQVTCEGIRLIGRVPSELAQEMEAHALAHGTGLRFGASGDVCCDRFQLELGGQRAGDRVVSWAVFFDAGDDHSIARDAMPEGVWRAW
jgi:hypothetical protein